jgi:hypothetical protein
MISLGDLKLIFTTRFSMDLTLALAQPLYCKTIRAIDEYYFWYDQILAPFPGNGCFV